LNSAGLITVAGTTSISHGRGEAEGAHAARHEIFYFGDNANLNALRYDRWKIHFL